MDHIIHETYDSLQKEKIDRISAIENALLQLPQQTEPAYSHDAVYLPKAPLDILDEIIKQKSLTRADIEILVEKIVVDKDGNIDLYLKHRTDELNAEG